MLLMHCSVDFYFGGSLSTLTSSSVMSCLQRYWQEGSLSKSLFFQIFCIFQPRDSKEEENNVLFAEGIDRKSGEHRSHFSVTVSLDFNFCIWKFSEILHSFVADMEFVQNFTPPDFQAKNFTPSISPNFNSFSKKKHKKWVKMKKFTPLAKILQCRRLWRHGQIPPLDHQDFQDQYHQDQQIVCCYLCCPPCAVWERTSDGEVPWFQTFSFGAGQKVLSTIPPIILSFCLSFDFWHTWQRLTE